MRETPFFLSARASARPQVSEEHIDGVERIDSCRVDPYIGSPRSLVRRIHAGERLESPLSNERVQALRVTTLRDIEWCVDEDLQERPPAQDGTRQPPVGFERGDGCHDHDEAARDEQFRHLGGASDVLASVGLAEPEVTVQARTEVVAVQHDCAKSIGIELSFEQSCNGRLARTRKSGEPEDDPRLRRSMRRISVCDWWRTPIVWQPLQRNEPAVVSAPGPGGCCAPARRQRKPLTSPECLPP